MQVVKTIIITGLALAVAVTAGCGKLKSNAVEEQDCAPCVGGECKLPGALAAGPELEEKFPGNRSSQTAPVDTGAAKDLIKTVYRKLPGAGKSDEAVVAKVAPKRANDVQAMAGREGHYNDIKLPGMGHVDQPEEQPFLARTFNKNVWPGGMPLEAEIDPEVANF